MVSRGSVVGAGRRDPRATGSVHERRQYTSLYVTSFATGAGAVSG